nr:hypothetical protein [uncultured Rhodopila sp.]
MTDASRSAVTLPTRLRWTLKSVGMSLRQWWDSSGWLDASQLTKNERDRPATIAMFYAEIGRLADRSCLSSDKDPKDPTALPPDWKKLSNSMVLTALQADRKFAPGAASDSDAGIALLRQAIDDAKRRLPGLYDPDFGSDGRPDAGGDVDAMRRSNAARHRISYYRLVLALLHVRLGRALERAGDTKSAEDAFRAALVRQPSLMPYTAQEFARFLGSLGRFEEAEQALRAARSFMTLSARIDMAQWQAAITGSFIEGARPRGELRKVLPIIQRNIDDLASCRTELGDTNPDQSGELLAWQAHAAGVKGDLLVELGDNRLAAAAFKISLNLYTRLGRLQSSVAAVSERLGDAHVRLGAAGAAEDAYAYGVEQWRTRQRPEDERSQAKLPAGKYALMMLAKADAKALGSYEAEFPGGTPGPFQTLTEQADLLLDRPDVANRFKLVLDSRLRQAPDVARARDCVFALRQLIVRAVPPLDFPEAAADAQTIRPLYEGIRLVLDTSLVGIVPDLSATLLTRAAKARQRIQAEWGVGLPGIQMTDTVGECRFQILIHDTLVAADQIPAAAAIAKPFGFVAIIRAFARFVMKAAPDGTLAPAAEQVFAALESCIAWNLSRLVGQTELFWMLEGVGLLPPEGTVERFEIESAAVMVPLIRVVRSLIDQQVRLVPFTAVYGRFVAGLAAGEAPGVIVSAIRRMPEVNARLWGSAPGTILYRLPSEDARRLAEALAGQIPRADRLLQAFGTQCAALPAGACVVVPDPAIREPLQELIAADRHPVLTDDEVPMGRLATAERLALAKPESPAAEAAPLAANGAPPGPVRRLRRLIEQESLRRGLSRAIGRAVFRAAVESRDGDFCYAAELALDPYGPEKVEVWAGTGVFGALEAGAAAGMPDLLRVELYKNTGVYIPPIQVRLDDALPPEEAVFGFNALRERLPPAIDQLSFETAMRDALIRHLVAFVGNRQVERLLTRLNKEQPLLVANALERLRVPVIIGELRRLVAAHYSIRDLQNILDRMLIYSG